MANTYNYVSNTTNLDRIYKRYMVSRVIDNPLDILLEVEAPTDLPNNFMIEMMFYSIEDNTLLSWIIVDSNDSDVLQTVTINYDNLTSRKLLFIDFSKIQLDLAIGRFQLVLNFFVPEIGTYNESAFVITQISPSRRELELNLNPRCTTPQYKTLLKNFSYPEISSEWVNSALIQIFNQPTSSISNSIPTDKTNLTASIIKEYLPDSSKNFVAIVDASHSAYSNTVNSNLQKFMNSAYNYATHSINNLNYSRYTNEILSNIVSSSIATASRQYQQVPEFIFV